MRATRCRSCAVLTTGGELVPVVDRRGRASAWYLCGRCWGLLVIGLRSQLRNEELNPFVGLAELGLRARRVRAAIREGLQVVARHGARSPTEQEEVLREGEQLLGELQALTSEVEESTSYGIPSEAWRGVRERIFQVRTQMRALRQHYRGA